MDLLAVCASLLPSCIDMQTGGFLGQGIVNPSATHATLSGEREGELPIQVVPPGARIPLPPHLCRGTCHPPAAQGPHKDLASTRHSAGILDLVFLRFQKPNVSQ